ncbi:hypothetical protein DPMN_127823 [Dreissena polymorpha]|uniref:Uncharacterized protein n=1 Tax=Dreissena polymorpha TaxID=45954 RepID=A0A9D4JVT5_DREPO|nr:hypothetical protein DPMN_127823 [Dreissena polymorpha]
MTSRVFTRKLPSPLVAIFMMIGQKNVTSRKTNVLIKFHENWAKNVTSRKTAPPTGGHVFSPIWAIFELFHDDWAKNPFYYINIRKTAPFKLDRDIIGTNLQTKFHEDRTRNVSSRVFTTKCGRMNDRRTDDFPILNQNVNARVFTNQMWTDGRWTKTNPKTSPEQSAIFQLVREINKTNAKNVTSIVFDHKVNCPTPLAAIHVIQLTGTIFELNSRIKETNVLPKFHEIRAENVTSRVFTCFHYIHIEKNDLPTGGNVFSPIWTIFNLVRDINKTNVLTNFHDDWDKIVTSRVFTRKTAPPTGGHVSQQTGTTFELNQHIIKANILTKFHENWTKNVTSRAGDNGAQRVLTSQTLMISTHGERIQSPMERYSTWPL